MLGVDEMLTFFRKKILRTCVTLVSCGMVNLTVVHADYSPTEEQRRLLFDHESHNLDLEKLPSEELPKELLEGKLGDFINPDTGELGFWVVDLDIPGNFDIPVRVARILDSDTDRPKFTRSQIVNDSRSGTANWGLDLPYILLGSINSSGTVGCMDKQHMLDFKDEMYVQPRMGLEKKTWPLLKTKNVSNTDVFGSNQPEYTNKEMWRVNQTKTNGKCTWTAVDPDGTTYEYGQDFVIENDNGKRKHAMMVTKITDVHGNWVNFTYRSNHKHLTKIESSDGRKITLVYRDNRWFFELECILTDNRSLIWVYNFKYVPGTQIKYLSKVWLMQDIERYWEYDQMAGVYDYNRRKEDEDGNRARRCVFGTNARVRSPDGLVGNFTTKKIVNFAEANSANAIKGASHRAACLADSDGGDYADGTSKHGNFITYFTSAVTSKKLSGPGIETATWTYEYDEGDLYNTNTFVATVHKNKNKPVDVDITKPKKRTFTDPLGTKYEFKIGRSLNDTGQLISQSIYAKGSKKATRTVEYEQVFSQKPLGHAFSRDTDNSKSNEHWSRVSKRTWTQEGVIYTKEYEYDNRGYETKTTASSTLQTGKIVNETKYQNLTSKWILGLPIKKTRNKKEVWSSTRDSKGQIILEKHLGAEFERKRWNADGTLAETKNGKQHIKKFENYKRGTPQKVTDLNGAVTTKIVDNKGWVSQVTNPSGYTEKFTRNRFGWVLKIDRPVGYADTVIKFTPPSASNGVVEEATTGTGKRKKVVKTTYDGYGDRILVKTSNNHNRIEIYEKIKYDKLRRINFKSWKSSSFSASAGIETKYDELGRPTEEKETVSPNVTTKTEYLTDNRIRETDENGVTKTKHYSGYGSPSDGKLTLVENPNGMKEYLTYDVQQNLTRVRYNHNGTNFISTFKYNSRNQLCLHTTPESLSIAYTYDEVGLKSSKQWGVSSTYKCEDPVTVNIADFVKPKPSTTPSKKPVTKPTTNPSTTPTTTNPLENGCSGNEIWRNNRCEPLIPGTLPYSEKSNSNTITYSYNELGQETKVDFSSATEDDILRTYDKAGNETKVTRGNIIRENTFGKRRELLKEVLKVGDTTYTSSYTYSNTGGKTSHTTPTGVKISYSLDFLDRPTALIIGSKSYVSDVEYFPNGILKTAKLHTKHTNSKEAILLKNELNTRMLLKKTTLSKNGVDDLSEDYAYYKNRQLKSVNDSVSENTKRHDRKFVYDNMNQLTSASNTSRTESFEYDGFKNIVSMKFRRSDYERDFSQDFEKEIALTIAYDSKSNLIKTIVEKVTTVLKETHILRHESSSLTVGYDSRGKALSTVDGVHLAYNKSDLITKALSDSKIVFEAAYDGNGQRAWAKLYNDGQSFSTNTFQSDFSNLFFQEDYINSGSNKQILSNVTVSQFGRLATLNISKCIFWSFQNHFNNTVIIMTDKNEKFLTSTLGPYGSSWIENYELKELEQCQPENNTTVEEKKTPSSKPTKPAKPTTPSKPAPTPNPGNPGSPLNPGNPGLGPNQHLNSPSAVGATVSAISNETSEVPKRPIFRNSTLDPETKLFYFVESGYYEPYIGRFITPTKSRNFNKSMNSRTDINLYDIRNNDPVNFEISPRYSVFDDDVEYREIQGYTERF